MTRQVSGFGDAKAPPGSEAWAQRWRIDLYGAIRQLDLYPSKVESLVRMGVQHRAWTVLKDERGEHWKDFDAFCCAPAPYGLASDPTTIRAAIAQVHGERAAALDTTPVAKSPPGKKNDTGSQNSSAEKQLHARHRAILRAPAEIQDLYRAGLISQKLAAKLGPKTPSEEQLDVQKRAVLAIREVERDRKAIDGVVRAVIGRKEPSRVDRALRLVEQMTSAERARFTKALAGIL